MKVLKSDKFAAVVILLAAVFGFSIANSQLASSFHSIAMTNLNFGIQLHLEEWVSEFGLAFFFLLIGIELRHEFTHGAFQKFRNAIPPLVAAALGVFFPAVLYALVNLKDATAIRGWAIPTATDVTFAMAIFFLFGRNLPPLARTFLLTIVVADDLIAIAVIAVVFPSGFHAEFLGLATMLAVCFWGVFRCSWNRWLRLMLAIVLGLSVWYCFLESGIHPVIAGVLLGALLPNRFGELTAKTFAMPVNLIALPVFAAFSAAVSLSQIGELSGVFFGILIGPIGKVLGIAIGGWLGFLLIKASAAERLSIANLARLGALGGIGFTVSLLVAQLSFRNEESLTSQATFAVLAASVLSMVFGSISLATAKRT